MARWNGYSDSSLSLSLSPRASLSVYDRGGVYGDGERRGVGGICLPALGLEGSLEGLVERSALRFVQTYVRGVRA